MFTKIKLKKGGIILKSLTLAHDIFRGEFNLSNEFTRNLIISISSAKVILDNKERLNIDLDYSWPTISLNKGSLIEVLLKINDYLQIYLEDYNEYIIKVLSKLKDSEFDKLINIINEVVDSKDIIGFCKEIRTTANVYGKIHDCTTPYRALEIPVKIIKPSLDNTIIDSFNGESGTEIVIKEFLQLNDEDSTKLQYYGEEKNYHTYSIGKLINFLITGNISNIMYGDSILEPKFLENDNIREFDVAISSPSFGVKLTQEEMILIETDRYNRCKYGVSNSDWLTAIHVLSTMKPTGKGAILLPLGALLRSGADERVRKSIINEDLIEAVVKLPAGILPNTNIATAWVIFNKNKDEKRKNKIQFIDISKYIESIDRRNITISEEGVMFAEKSYNNGIESDDNFILDINVVMAHEYSLNAFEYMKTDRLLKNIDNLKMIDLSSIAQIRRGVQVNKGKLDALNTSSNRTHYLISIGNIVDGKIKVDESDKIQIEQKWEGVYETKPGDILVTSKGSQFKVAIVEKDMKAIVSSNLFIIRVYENKYIPEVLKYYLESDLGTALIQGIIKGTTIQSIAYKDLEKFKVPSIELDLQKDVAIKIKESETEYEERLRKAKIIYEEQQNEISNILNLNM